MLPWCLIVPKCYVKISYDIPAKTIPVWLHHAVQCNILYIRVSQKKWKFCDSGKMMGEVIIKWFYFYFFRFRQLLERAMLKPKLQILRCAHAQKQMGRIYYKNAAENYRKKKNEIFLVWSQYGKWCKFSRNVDPLCNKISENPRKGFFTIARSGDEKKSKNEYIFEPYVTQAFLIAPGHGMFHEKKCILGHPIVHDM